MSNVFRPGGVSYLRIPAADIARAASFYADVFGWSVAPERGSFEDATGHVIGHFIAELPVAGEAGVLPYVFVERLDATLEKAISHGAQVATAPYPEGNLRVATIRDPAGNVIGIWERAGASRESGEAGTAA